VEEVSNVNPYHEVENLITADISKWKEGSFVVNRLLHEQDEQLCKAIELAVWVC
jgi:hypothetical protein